VIANFVRQLNVDVLPNFYWEARGKTCPLFVPGCMCGLGKEPILGDDSEGAQGSLVDPVAQPRVVRREEPSLPPWVFDLEPPFGQLPPAGPEDDPFFLPPSPTTLSSRESSPLPDPGLAPVESQTDAAEAAAEESAETTEPAACLCGRPDSDQNMIACGTEPHPGEVHAGGVAWFHLSCAGLERAPRDGKHTRNPLTLVLNLHVSIDEEWYCGECHPEMEANDIARRAGSGGKKLPGASSPTPKPRVLEDEGSLEPEDSEQAPSDGSLSPEPPRRKRKAETLGPERPKKRHADAPRMGHGGPTTPTFAAPRLAKRKVDEGGYEPPQKKHKIGTDRRGAKMPQRTDAEVQAAPSSAHVRGTTWSAAEEAATITIMQDLVAGTNAVYGDRRWQVCARRLKKDHGLTRSGPAIKNHWNRVLRARTGLDERRTPNPNKMVTGLLTPRKKQRTAQNLFSRSALSEVPEEDEDEEEERVEGQDDEEERVEDQDDEKDEVEVEEVTEKEGRAQTRDNWDNETYIPSRKRKLRGGAEY